MGPHYLASYYKYEVPAYKSKHARSYVVQKTSTRSVELSVARLVYMQFRYSIMYELIISPLHRETLKNCQLNIH